MTLADFLAARIAEDEADARQHRDLVAAVAETWTPHRVARECESKRRIMAIHQPLRQHPEWVALGQLPQCAECGGERGQRVWPCETLRGLAAIYADHPDYREEWRS